MKFLLFFVLAVRALSSYVDEELLDLWASIPNIYEPTLADYRLIESYLQNGRRPYLENLPETSWTNIGDEVNVRVKIIRDFKLVGPNGEMPIFEKHELNVTEETKDRCVLVFGSYNPPYPEKVYHVLQELKECGYSGTVMIRIGGYPNLSHEGLKSSPFHGRWKLEFFKEARRMGYKKIVHLDTHVHPTCDLSAVFQVMDENGGFFYGHGPWLNVNKNFMNFGPYLNIPPEQMPEIHFVSGCVLGLNFSNRQVVKLFDEWEERMRRVDQFYCIGQEEITFMALAHKYHLTATPPSYSLGDFPPDMANPSNGWMLFFFDMHRVPIRYGWGALYD